MIETEEAEELRAGGAKIEWVDLFLVIRDEESLFVVVSGGLLRVLLVVVVV